MTTDGAQKRGMETTMRIAIAQLNPTVGDLDGNLAKMLAACARAKQQGAEIIVFPTHVLTGAPLCGLLSHEAFLNDAVAHLDDFVRECPLTAFVSAPALAVVQDEDGGNRVVKAVPALYMVSEQSAEILSSPTVHEGKNLSVVEFDELTVAVSFSARFTSEVKLPQVDALIEVTGSRYGDASALPAATGELDDSRDAARANGAFLVNANSCGASDDVVFAGNSLAIAPDGTLLHAAPVDEEDFYVLDTEKPEQLVSGQEAQMCEEERLWRGIVTGTRDYLRKNGLSDVVIGLSGGIDSAVVAAVAADAVGAEHVHGLLMPGPYSSEGSLSDASELAENLGIETLEIPIEEPLESLHETLAAACGGSVDGLAAENLQARLRTVYLLTVSNARGWIVLNTGNKSEAAMGFSTLYGDTVGAYAPIGQLYKTQVYALARWRAEQGPSIPLGSIEKPPSAELYPGATDQDRLPPYEQLDEVLLQHVEYGQGAEALVEAGFDRELVSQVLSAVRKNEFKRRIEPIGPHVSGTSFTDGRAWPITNGWRERSGE